ncbi:MAG: AAC(3) family N-acetyltransferase [Magnetospirillum sp. WYHS-4]
MNEQEAIDLYTAALRHLGIGRGDIVYLAVDMARLPLPAYPAKLNREAIRAREQRWCAFVLERLQETIGPEGTLIAPTFFYSYARSNGPYIHEESPSETGPFTEYFRTLPEARRSLHPIYSVAAIGPLASEIADGIVGKSAFGAMSVFGRLTRYPIKFLFLGASVGESLTHAHHLEHMYGCNHRYHMVFNTPVSMGGHEIPGPWLCFMRYLGTPVRADVFPLERRLRERGVLVEWPDWPHPMQMVTIEDAERIGYEMLAEAPWSFTREPVEIHMESPGKAPHPALQTAVRFHPDPEERP